ncbi:similar to SirZ [Plenodomus lingam JN3]|uniref:C6 finger domain transcription factor sirZ n=2 Tax=Leptosphaeria maculans TaxID=5022 RepID=SIRZ_LEPMC|nr:similar to SirZ [Plenodomus lingam JN3]Q6Q877.1 RecName: Full=C6 finger domain transcription factor sirZ; AltName: Full=Sirodesmin production protein Z [Plenodomus lingam]AAS92551.1 SirZ [Plenodomus lingam]CBX98936.1 similar to SirZ [Plenodomus lingam JN3]
MSPAPPPCGFAEAESTNTKSAPKFRSACNACHEVKLKCLGGQPCARCRNKQVECVYSHAARIGKPKGSRNKKTLERLRQAKAMSRPEETQGEETTSLTAVDASQAINCRALSGSTRRDSSPLPPPHSDTDSAEGGAEEELLDQEERDEAEKPPLVENPPNLNPLEQISPPREDFLDLLAHSSLLNNTQHDLQHPTADMVPDGLAGFPHASTSAADDLSWMTSPTKSLLSTTFPAIEDDLQDLQDPFLCSSWRSACLPPSSSRSSFHFPRFNHFAEDTMGLEYASGMDATRSLGDPPHAMARAGSFSTSGPGSSQEGSHFLSSRHSQSSGMYQPVPKRPSCSCLKLQASALCRIHLVDRSHADMRGDTVLATASTILDSCNALILCPSCATDYKFLLLAIMTVRILLCWLRGLSATRTQNDNANMKLTLGEYEISGEEEAIIKNMLVSRALEKVKIAVRRLRERVNSITIQEVGNCSESTQRWDLTYIRMCLDHMEKQVGC